MLVKLRFALFLLQIRRSILNEDEYGFRKAKRPVYYDEGLEVRTYNFHVQALVSEHHVSYWSFFPLWI